MDRTGSATLETLRERLQPYGVFVSVEELHSLVVDFQTLSMGKRAAEIQIDNLKAAGGLDNERSI